MTNLLRAYNIENKVKTSSPKLVLLDRDCRFCSGLGHWLRRHPRAQNVQIADSSSWPEDCPWPADISHDYLVYLSASNHWYKGEAAVLALAYDLGGVWRILSFIARVFPRQIRCKLYLIWSRNRYRMFGKTEHCERHI